MLILSRYRDERIVITTDTGIIIVQVLDIASKRKSVRLGFVAPKGIKINREEIEELQRNGTSTNHPS
jgi:carbon storage regulator CsrA